LVVVKFPTAGFMLFCLVLHYTLRKHQTQCILKLRIGLYQLKHLTKKDNTTYYIKIKIEKLGIPFCFFF